MKFYIRWNKNNVDSIKTGRIVIADFFPELTTKTACSIQAGIYLLKVNNRNTRTRCEICSKLTIKTPEL